MTRLERVRCKRCVLSEAFPGVELDEDGVCRFCREAAQAASGHEAIARAKEKIDTLIRQKKGASGYDALMCYSGGKDSTLTMMLAVRKYGLKVLSFTLDNGFLSPGALENINRVVDALGVDQITVRPSADFFRAAITASVLHDIYSPRTLVRVSSGCHTCISLVNITALKFALEKEIPFILAGFTLGQIPSNGVIYKNNYGFLQKSRAPVMSKLRELVGGAVDDYYGIRASLVEGVTAYPYNLNLLCVEDMTEEDIVKAIEPLGWQRPEDVDGCSTNCRLNTFNNYVHQKKFGYSPYELELSHLVRHGQLTRAQALQKIEDQPKEQLQYIMDELGIHGEALDVLMTRREHSSIRTRGKMGRP